MLDFLFGEGQYGLRFLVAFIVVLGLIGLSAWLVRRFGAERLGASATRGRQPRLAVIDATAVDGRRRLILIRRDNVEHLLMIGGPSDIVIEPNIVRAAAAPRDVAPPRPPAAAEPMPRPVTLGEGGTWPLQPEPAPMPPPPRPHRPAPPPVVEETTQWRAEPEPPPRQNRALDPLAGLAAELSRNPPQPEPVAPPPPPRPARAPARERDGARDQEPARAPARAPQPAALAEAPFASSADQNLAEMAQRLEAALRRPGKAEARTEPKPAPQPEPAPRVEREAAPAPVEATPAQGEAKPAHEARPAAPQKSPYDSLEQEMASLLGRPGNKS